VCEKEAKRPCRMFLCHSGFSLFIPFFISIPRHHIMPRPPKVAVGGPGVRAAPFRVSPWQQARRGGGGGGAVAAADANDGQSDADDGPSSPSPSPPAVSGGSSAEEEPGTDTLRLAGPALFAYYPPGVLPPPIPGVLADPLAGESAVAGRLVDEEGRGATVWAVGASLADAALAGVPADCSFSAGDRLVALGLHGPRAGGAHVTAVLAQASGGDGASLAAPPADGPRGREARALLCGAGCAPARGAAPRLRFVCETLLVRVRWERREERRRLRQAAGEEKVETGCRRGEG